MAKVGTSRLERLEHAAEVAAAALTFLAGTLVFAGVVLRNLFTISPSWIAELPVHLFVWAVFLALAGSFSRGPQMGIDLLVRQLPAGVQSALAAVAALGMLVTALMLVWLGAELVLRQYSGGAVSVSAARTPLWLVTLALPTGCALLAMHAFARMVTPVKADSVRDLEI